MALCAHLFMCRAKETNWGLIFLVISQIYTFWFEFVIGYLNVRGTIYDVRIYV